MGSVVKSNANKEFSIALLIEDIKEAKELSDSLREIGIFAHYYEDLDDLWVSINTHTPDLCIVDVKKMSQGTLLFKQHPKVQNKALKYAFYFKEATQLLLNSTHGLDHYGLIRGELNLVDQMRSILRRRNQELRLTDEVNTLTKRLDKLRQHGKRLSLTGESSQATLNQYGKLENLIAKFGRVDSVDEFSKRLVSFFNEWDDCYQFGIYQLNSTKQKLVAPKARAEKYKILPDLWLSSECTEGIKDYAQEMAYEVAYGLMDENILASRIFGIEENPDLLIIGQYNKAELKKFNWDLLEGKLNSEYRRVLAKENMQQDKKSSIIPIFETLQTMDDVQFYKSEIQHKYVTLDFSRLIDFIKQSYNNRFSWKSFSSEFCTELSNSLNGNFELSHMGVETMVIALDKKYVDTDINRLKTFCRDFQFWRYFDDTSIIVTQNLTPDIHFITPSSVNLIRQAQDGFSNIMEESIPVTTRRAPQIRRERQIEV
jgi:hypothetical protein